MATRKEVEFVPRRVVEKDPNKDIFNLTFEGAKKFLFPNDYVQPRRSVGIKGRAGTNKTTIAFDMAANYLEKNLGRGLYISVEQEPESAVGDLHPGVYERVLPIIEEGRLEIVDYTQKTQLEGLHARKGDKRRPSLVEAAELHKDVLFWLRGRGVDIAEYDKVVRKVLREGREPGARPNYAAEVLMDTEDMRLQGDGRVVIVDSWNQLLNNLDLDERDVQEAKVIRGLLDGLLGRFSKIFDYTLLVVEEIPEKPATVESFALDGMLGLRLERGRRLLQLEKMRGAEHSTATYVFDYDKEKKRFRIVEERKETSPEYDALVDIGGEVRSLKTQVIGLREDVSKALSRD